MSFSVFYAVRFSPAPELGEWLNVAVVGEGINERKAGVIVADSLERIEAAFGPEAVERVKAICSDLTNLVATMVTAFDRGETTQPIPTAMRDHALSMSFSDQIMVFEGSFEDALRSIAKRYLSPLETEEQAANRSQTESRPHQAVTNQQEIEISRIANSLQNTLARFSREIFPAGVGKSLEQGQKAIENFVHGAEVSTILVIGGTGHLGSALLPRLLESGKRVRLFHPSANGPTVVEIVNPNVGRGMSIGEIARRAGVSNESVSHVLDGATERLKVSQKTADKIKDIAGKLGHVPGNPGLAKLESEDVASAMTGVDAVIYIPDAESDQTEVGIIYAKAAKSGGVKRFIVAGPGAAGETAPVDSDLELRKLGEEGFSITVLRMGELFGHGNSTQWFGDLHDTSGRLHTHPSVNALTANAMLKGKVSAVDTGPHPYIHVEDAASAVLAVLTAAAGAVNRQVYDVGSEAQIRSVGEIAQLIKDQVPNVELVIAVGESESATAQIHFSQFNDELGFAASRSLEEGITQLITSLQDGSVSSYMSVRAADPEVAASAPDTASDIRWDSLTIASVETETSDSASDQTRQKH